MATSLMDWSFGMDSTGGKEHVTNEMVKKIIGERVRRCLVAKDNMSQKALAELMDVTPGAVSSWIRGDTGPSFSHMIQLTELFGVTLCWLYGRDLPKGNLTEEEERLVRLYRLCNADGKSRISRVAIDAHLDSIQANHIVQ